MQTEKIIIEFVKKELYQKRKEYKHETWFALSNSIMENPDYCLLNPIEFKALIYLYCQCSKNKWAPTTINYKHAEKLFDISQDCLNQVLAILLANQKVIIHEPITNRSRTCHEPNRAAKDTTDIKDITENKEAPPADFVSDSLKTQNRSKFNFAEIFELYPNPQKKTSAIKLMSEKVGQEETFNQLKTAVIHFADFHKVEQTEIKFIPYFINWFADWRDWLIKRAGKPPAQRKVNGRPEVAPPSYSLANQEWQAQAAEAEKVKQENAALTPEQREEKRKQLVNLILNAGLKIPKFNGGESA